MGHCRGGRRRGKPGRAGRRVITAWVLGRGVSHPAAAQHPQSRSTFTPRPHLVPPVCKGMKQLEYSDFTEEDTNAVDNPSPTERWGLLRATESCRSWVGSQGPAAGVSWLAFCLLLLRSGPQCADKLSSRGLSQVANADSRALLWGDHLPLV